MDRGWVSTPVARCHDPGALVVTSHDRAAVNEARFDNVSLAIAPSSLDNLLTNPGFEDSAVPNMEPGWVSDAFREANAHTATAAPHSGAQYGACETTTTRDCGIFQDLTAPATGVYVFRAYVAANKPGVLIGINVNGSSRILPRCRQADMRPTR